MNAVGGVSNQSSGGGNDAAGADVAAFSAAAAAAPAPTLTVSGNTIDTGRYQITGSNLYTRPTDGGTADDGMVKVLDTTTNTFVDVFGDPHVYTSDGDRAEFQKDALEINLADGTQLQFKPTAVTSDGVSHIDALAVSRGGQTVVETGLYSADGSAKVSTGAVRQGGPATAQGFNDPNATVMTTAPGGGLDTLVNQAGVQLSSKTSQTALDGMGGAANAPSSVSPQLIAVLQHLLGLLQKQMSAASVGFASAGAVVSAASQGAQSGQGAASATQQLIGLLQTRLAQDEAQLSGATPAGRPATLAQQLMPFLQQMVAQLGSDGPAIPVNATAPLAQQVIPMLGSAGPGALPPATGGVDAPAGAAQQPNRISLSAVTGVGFAPEAKMAVTAQSARVSNPLFQALLAQVIQDLQMLEQKLQQSSPAATPQAGAAPAGASSKVATSAGTGPNTIEITNTSDHAITVGKFKNGESTTAPSAQVTLQPSQVGALHYDNGEAGFAAKADSTGKFQPNASRLEYEADKDGRLKYPDVSYIDGRNASISLTDGAGLSKGDSKSIAAAAPARAVSADAAGDKTIAGWYDGSTPQMQAGGAYLQGALGTSGAYLHPNDDTLPSGQNPMSSTQRTSIEASFGDA